jgi:hypothetical protein
MNNDYFVWSSCAYKAASAAVNKECLSILRDKQMGAEDKLLALRALLHVQAEMELNYTKAMERAKS